MGVANWLRNHWFGVSVVTLLASVGVLAVLTVYGGLLLLGAVLAGDATLFEAVLDDAAPFLVGGTAVLVVALVSAAGVAWGLGRRLWDVSARGLDRLADWAARVETDDYRAAVSAVGESGDDYVRAATASLKRTYVEGDIGEAEFERAVEGLAEVDAAASPEPLVDRE